MVTLTFQPAATVGASAQVCTHPQESWTPFTQLEELCDLFVRSNRRASLDPLNMSLGEVSDLFVEGW